MKKVNFIIGAIALTTLTVGCKKEGCTDPTALNFSEKAKKDDGSCQFAVDQSTTLRALGANVIAATYADLSSKTTDLYDAVNAFATSPSASGLQSCKDLWKSSRQSWESSEGFLFGPVATANIDPRIDTWPVDFNSLDSVINSSIDFTVDANIDALADALKGFHPIEYLLWGQNGTKTEADFTARELEYLQALSKNVQSLTLELTTNWNTSSTSTYYTSFSSPGSGNSFYPTTLAAYEELVNGVIGICDEVANGKMSEPFTMQDPSLVESPYSKNSITDFTNNLISVQNIYLGKYITDGVGLTDFVSETNLSLDNTIKSKITNAITKLQAISDPFGQAITTQSTLVQNAIDAINDLKSTLETELLPHVQQYVN